MSQKKINDERLELIEKLAVKMESPENYESFAIDHSILQDEEVVKTMERIQKKYYFLLPFMLILAVYMMFKVLAYRFIYVPFMAFFFKKKFTKERLLLGPKRGTIFFDKYNKVANLLRNGVTTSIALDITYNLPKIIAERRSISQCLVWFWINQPDGLGGRNRLKLIYSHIIEKVSNKLEISDEVNILSLACGSAQAIIEALAKLRKDYPSKKINLTLVDLNQTSLQMAKYLAEKRGVSSDIKLEIANIKNFLDNQPNNTWDIIEMVGFLDYRKNNSVIKISTAIRRILKPGGVFITSSVSPSLWSYTVRWVTNWPLLIRRSKNKFRKILMKGWQEDDNQYFRYVPTKTHVIAILTKKIF